MVRSKILVGQIDIGVNPDLHYLSDLTIRLTRLDREGRPYSAPRAYKGDLHGSQVASIICGPYYEGELPRITEIEVISIPRLGKTVLCLLRALDTLMTSGIRILCMPVGINLPTPVFWPFMKAMTKQGVLIVVPSGNKGKGTVLTPGSYPEVLTVGALNMAGNIARYSGRFVGGSENGRKPDIFARGEFPNPADPNSGKTIRGTSMSCAFVAGKAARIWQMFPEANLPEIWAKLDAKPAPATPGPHFLGKRYIDSRLKASLNHLKENDPAEGIIISGNPSEGCFEPIPIGKLLDDVKRVAGFPPLEVNYFGVTDVVHLRAPKRFFEALLIHKDLYCAQAVDVSMFDM